MSNILKVCDYVTLYLEDGKPIVTGTTVYNSIYRWEIPQGAWVSNERSQVCTVELTEGAFSTKKIGNAESSPRCMIVEYLNGGYNQHSSRGRPVIAVTNSTTLTSTRGFT